MTHNPDPIPQHVHQDSFIKGLPSWKLIVFALVAFFTFIFFYQQSTNGFTDSELYKVKCAIDEPQPDRGSHPEKDWSTRGDDADTNRVARKKQSEDEQREQHLINLISCRDGTDRRRLAINYLIQEHGRIAEQVILIRDRIRDLATGSKETSDWALNFHLAFMWVVFILLAFAAIFKTKTELAPPTGVETTLQKIGRKIQEMSVTATLLGALILAAAQSLAYNTKYEASYVAWRAFKTLELQVDTEIVSMVRRSEHDPQDEINPVISNPIKTLDYVAGRLTAWTSDIKKIENAYAEAYAGAELIKIPGG